MSRIAALNDALRAATTPAQMGKNRIVMTRGVSAKGLPFALKAQAAVRAFATFTEDNDPHGEHDFGMVEVEGERLMWKIDCYDPTMTYASEDPADPDKTVRVLTILLAEEY